MLNVVQGREVSVPPEGRRRPHGRKWLFCKPRHLLGHVKALWLTVSYGTVATQFLVGKLKGRTGSLGSLWPGLAGIGCTLYPRLLIILFVQSVWSEVL